MKFLIMCCFSLLKLGLFEVCDYALSPGCLLEEYDDLKGVKKNPLGYIISTYQTFPGEDNEKLEETWFNWTGRLFCVLYKTKKYEFIFISI